MEIDKPPIIEEKRESKKEDTVMPRIFVALIAIIIAGVFVQHRAMLRDAVKNESAAWDREGRFYKDMRERGILRLSGLSKALDNLGNEKEKIQGQFNALILEKAALEKERDTLGENLRLAEAKAKDALLKKEQEVKVNLSREYEERLASITKKLAELDKIEKELQSQKESVQKLEEELNAKSEEIKKIKNANRELLEGLMKANQSNEYLMKKIEDLQKVRNELEEELRRSKQAQK